MNVINDYRKIVVEKLPLIDVRAPIEYEKGAFINSVNLPLMDNTERELVGICYKEKGPDKALELGHRLVSGKIKESRVNTWVSHITNFPDSIIYCFRGGMRSKITQAWIKEAINKEIPYIEGGYKAFRTFLLNALNPDNIKSIPIILTGKTGAGKTSLLANFSNFIDLEKIANHRGSTFGHYNTPQPTQINFENNLSYAIISHESHHYEYMLLEDEGKNIGKSYLPIPLVTHFNQSKRILLEVSMESRIQNTLNEYVIESQKIYGLQEWYLNISASIERIKKKLGFERYLKIINLLDDAYNYQINTNSFAKHALWIAILLAEYYDPMYEYQIKRINEKIIFSGNYQEVSDYLKEYYQK